MKLIWTEHACKDILSIKEYYIDKIPTETLENMALEIQRTGNLLEKSPNIGRSIGDDDVRRFNVGQYNYVLLYSIKNNSVNILRVIDTRRKPKPKY